MNVRMQGRRRVAAIVAQTNVGSVEYDQFRTKKNDGPLYPLRGHNTRTLAGIFGDIGNNLALVWVGHSACQLPVVSRKERFIAVGQSFRPTTGGIRVRAGLG